MTWTLEEIEQQKIERRQKKYPPDVVRKRKSYKWFEQMLDRFIQNAAHPEENLKVLHNELSSNGGFYTHRGALMRYKHESMEQVILDYKEKQKCNTSAQIGTLVTPTSSSMIKDPLEMSST